VVNRRPLHPSGFTAAAPGRVRPAVPDSHHPCPARCVGSTTPVHRPCLGARGLLPLKAGGMIAAGIARCQAGRAPARWGVAVAGVLAAQRHAFCAASTVRGRALGQCCLLVRPRAPTRDPAWSSRSSSVAERCGFPAGEALARGPSAWMPEPPRAAHRRGCSTVAVGWHGS
jgi:hypothetical protein